MINYDRPRLFRKTLRTSELAAGFTPLPATGESVGLAGHASLGRFAFAGKVKLKQRKHTETISGTLKTRNRLVLPHNSRLSPSPARPGSQQATPIRHHTPSPSPLTYTLSPTLTPAYAQSLQVSRESSPRAGGLLTIDAINLELELTAMLARTETMPSPQRRREALAAHMKVLQSLSLRDPIFGSVLSHLHFALSNLLQSTRIKEVSELTERNKELNNYITDQKLIIKQETEEKAADERVYETLLKEKALLGKKVQELSLHCRRNGERVGQRREHWEKKVEEMEDRLKAARKREMRLLSLLEYAKEQASSPQDSSPQVPPLDLLLSKDCSPFSPHLCSNPLSEGSTDEVKSGPSWELPEDPACNHYY